MLNTILLLYVCLSLLVPSYGISSLPNKSSWNVPSWLVSPDVLPCCKSSCFFSFNSGRKRSSSESLPTSFTAAFDFNCIQCQLAMNDVILWSHHGAFYLNYCQWGCQCQLVYNVNCELTEWTRTISPTCILTGLARRCFLGGLFVCKISLHHLWMEFWLMHCWTNLLFHLIL